MKTFYFNLHLRSKKGHITNRRKKKSNTSLKEGYHKEKREEWVPHQRKTTNKKKNKWTWHWREPAKQISTTKGRWQIMDCIQTCLIAQLQRAA